MALVLHAPHLVAVGAAASSPVGAAVVASPVVAELAVGSAVAPDLTIWLK